MIKETHEKDASTIYSVSYLLYHDRAALAHKYPKKKKIHAASSGYNVWHIW